jgi:uncharacterized protein
MSSAASAHVATSVPSGLADAQAFFRLGIRYSTGASVPADMVSAHKWFNIAAMRGNAEAARLRREIAGEMSEAEIATARRAARDSITRLFMRLLSCGR